MGDIPICPICHIGLISPILFWRPSTKKDLRLEAFNRIVSCANYFA